MPATNTQILVMENEARTAAQIQRELEQLGYSVTVVGSSGAALAKAAETHPDLVVIDAKRRHAGESMTAAREMRDRFGIPVAYLQLYERGDRTRSPSFLDNLRTEIEKELNITVDQAFRGRRAERSGSMWEPVPTARSARRPTESQWPGTILRSIGDGVVATDGDGTVRFINQRAQELTGWSESEALGKPLPLVVHYAPIETQRVDEPRATASAQSAAMEGVLVRTDGRQLPIEQRVTPIRGEAGSDGYVYVLHEASERPGLREERKRLDADASEETNVARALARVGRELITSLDGEELLERLCRLTVEELDCDYSHTVLWRQEEGAFAPVASAGDTSEQWESIRVLRVPREAVGRFLAQMEECDLVQVITAAERGQPLASLVDRYGTTASVYVALRRNGEFIGFQAAGYRGRARAFTPEQERIARGIAQLGSSALERARRVDELAQANRLKSDFVATMSHELRAPLHVIMGYNDLLLTGEFGGLSSEQTMILQRVHDTARQLAEVIQTTLEWSRIETGRLLLDRRATSAHELIEALEQETRELQQNPDVRFEWQVAADVPLFETDPVKLKVVLKNLFGNAVKFTSAGRITVSASRAGGGVEFLVADTGVGIAPEARAMIFEPFRQVGDGDSRGGVGLGLYIVRRILELLGGSVDVESEVGCGTTFRVWVPLSFPLVPLDERVAAVQNT